MWRHEYKYIISDAQLVLLRNRISGLMQPDSNIQSNGSYHIRSLYFDNIYSDCMLDNENGNDPREKFRIRIYNNSPASIKLELKQKENGLCRKLSNSLSIDEFTSLLNNVDIPIDEKRKVLNNLTHKIRVQGFKPSVIVDYVRNPYVFSLGNVRITFDFNITSSSAIDNFFEEHIPSRLILPVGMQLMEVKYDEFLPDFIYRALQLNDLNQTAFSKYYLCRYYKQ